MGDLIELKSYTKFILGNDGKLLEEVFTTSGRKIPLKELLSSLLLKHQNMGLMKSQAKKRYLLMWADHSCIMNNKHLLFTVKPIYSQKLYHTDEEMEELTLKKTDVQRLVEQPNVYIFAKARDSISEKLGDVESRLEDILQLNTPTKAGDNSVDDIVRFFHGEYLCCQNI